MYSGWFVVLNYFLESRYYFGYNNMMINDKIYSLVSIFLILLILFFFLIVDNNALFWR